MIAQFNETDPARVIYVNSDDVAAVTNAVGGDGTVLPNAVIQFTSGDLIAVTQTPIKAVVALGWGIA